MSGLAAFAGIMVAISMAVERCVEILKGLSPYLSLPNPDPKKDGRRAAALQTLAVIFGTIIAELSTSQIKGAVPVFSSAFGDWERTLGTCALIGFMASGGSAFWNHVLDLIGALKIQQEEAIRMQPETGTKVGVGA
jgi:tetrahydromethanopterin S-methyltransferase subunit C